MATQHSTLFCANIIRLVQVVMRHRFSLHFAAIRFWSEATTLFSCKLSLVNPCNLSRFTRTWNIEALILIQDYYSTFKLHFFAWSERHRCGARNGRMIDLWIHTAWHWMICIWMPMVTHEWMPARGSCTYPLREEADCVWSFDLTALLGCEKICTSVEEVVPRPCARDGRHLSSPVTKYFELIS